MFVNKHNGLILYYILHLISLPRSSISRVDWRFIRISLVAIPFKYNHEIVKNALQAHSIVNPMRTCLFHGSSHFSWILWCSSSSCYQLDIFSNYAIVFVLEKVYSSRMDFCTNNKIGHRRIRCMYGIPGMLVVMIEWVAFDGLSLLSSAISDPKAKVSVMSVRNQNPYRLIQNANSKFQFSK
ncbi:hypothetical protein THRCLA_11333 [Thraustotheca clavata]|uniref:Uncharacterized protein n=1 Tax=Thraustotheca clavata TaxID=74557 RepID=A0A1V9Y833_9STRA|nr:hypothetical protein THRCLA_11333 [Thraustotheca clavata]